MSITVKINIKHAVRQQFLGLQALNFPASGREPDTMAVDAMAVDAMAVDAMAAISQKVDTMAAVSYHIINTYLYVHNIY